MGHENEVIQITKGENNVISTLKNDDEGIVEFEATYTQKGVRDVHHETGAFKKVNDEWLYSTGMVKAMTVVREGRKIGRNEPCPCGSGKKYKQCCGR